MATALITWVALAVMVMLFMTTASRSSHPRGDRENEVSLFRCPLCRRWTAPVERADDVGVHVYCDRCQGFIGARALGADPVETRLVHPDGT